MRGGDSTIVSWSWQDDDAIVLKPYGEIDGARARLVCAVLRRALARWDRRVIVDLSDFATLDEETTALLTDSATVVVRASPHINA